MLFRYNSLFNPFFSDFDEIFENVTYPMNIIGEKDGSCTVEVAVIGKTKDDIKLTGKNEEGKNYLVIDTVEQENTETEKNRVYSIRKIKKPGKIHLEILVPDELDMDNVSAKVENGLLTINVKPVEKIEKEPEEIEYQIN